MRTPKTLVLIVVLSLALAACGGSLQSTLNQIGNAIKGGKEKIVRLAKEAGDKIGTFVQGNKATATKKGATLSTNPKAKMASSSTVKGGTQKSASTAKAAGAKSGSTTTMNKASATKAQPASATTGGVAKTPAAAMSSNTTQGTTTTANVSVALGQGTTYQSATCTDALAFCGDETHVAFCSGSDWYVLDCAGLDASAVCAEDSGTVDCYSTQSVDTTCDDSTELTAYCGDDTHLTFCSGGDWYQLDCAALEDNAECGEDDTTVDCYDTSVDDDVCDDAAEGVGFCSDDTHVTFCSSGEWYELDCAGAGSGGVCGESGTTVDCYTTGT